MHLQSRFTLLCNYACIFRSQKGIRHHRLHHTHDNRVPVLISTDTQYMFNLSKAMPLQPLVHFVDLSSEMHLQPYFT